MKFAKVLTLGLSLLLLGSGVAFAASQDAEEAPIIGFPAPTRVIGTQPAPDAALLPFAPGFAKIEYTTPLGNVQAHTEGVVIRGSYIEDGKIHIPPSGIYYTNRGPRSYALRTDMLNMLGQPWYLVHFVTQAGVLSNVYMKPGDRYYMLPDKYLTVTGITARGSGHVNPTASFTAMRPNGVAVGGIGQISYVPASQNMRDNFQPWGMPTGVYDLDPQFRFDQHNYTTNLDAAAGKYILGSALTPDGIMIDEALFHGLKYGYFTQTPPTTGYFGLGDTRNIGGYTMTVVGLDELAGTITISLKNAAGAEYVKTLGPLTPTVAHLVHNSEWEINNVLSMRDPDITVQVEMSVYRSQGLWRGGKVALNLYEDLKRFEAEMDWFTDPNWIYRPDT